MLFHHVMRQSNQRTVKTPASLSRLCPKENFSPILVLKILLVWLTITFIRMADLR